MERSVSLGVSFSIHEGSEIKGYQKHAWFQGKEL